MKTSKIHNLLNLAIKIAIVAAAYLYLYVQFSKKEGLGESWNYFIQSASADIMFLSLAGICCMMLLNWSLEALKWRYLVKKTERVGFFTAFRAVWAGVTVSTFTPNRTGEYFGRVFALKHTNPWKGAFMTVVGSLSQLLVTLVAGGAALLWFVFFTASTGWHIPAALTVIISVLGILLLAALVMLYFHVWLMEPLLRRFTSKRWLRLREHLQIFAAYSGKELLVVLLFSLARYVVFSLQFYLLLRLFMVPLPFVDGLLIIACVYFLLSGMPTIALTELGVRGALIMFFLDMYFANNYLAADAANMGAVSAASMLWLVNLVIPALAGGIFIMQMKFIRK
jgi:uncharacterized membrane protein YbhN (UPF0104 family)